MGSTNKQSQYSHCLLGQARIHRSSRIGLLAVLAFSFAWIGEASVEPAAEAPLQPHVPNHLFVHWLTATAAGHQDLRDELGAVVLRHYPKLGHLELWQLRADTALPPTIRACLASGLVAWAEPDYLIRSTQRPNDPSFVDGSQWYLDNTGQSGGRADADIDATNAWEIRRDAGDIIVGIIDTGLRTTHEDIRGNLWHNPNEIPNNGRDDDQNGYIDDVHGINAILDTGDPADDAGHGTHVAGILGAEGNNGVGIAGVAWDVQLMGLRFLNRLGEGATSDAIECITYAATNGAHVINASWGSNAFSQALNSAVSLALQSDIVLVAAAGNERRNNELVPLYPASYSQPNILSVAATDQRDGLASYSNYGAKSVDIAAPGNAILSTWGSHDRSYELSSGSSMSTPMVSGGIALMRAHFPKASALDIVTRLLATADPLPSLQGRSVSEGRLNVGLSLGPDLIAGFEHAPRGGAPPLRVRFEDRSLGDVTNWHWDFGDGSTESGTPQPVHTYNRAGNFPVTLRIESADGFTVSRTQPIPVVANYRIEQDFFDWLEPETVQTLDLADDGVSGAIPLPFLFPFYAKAYDQVFVGANGLIGFDAEGLETPTNQDLPDAAVPNSIVCPYWDDLAPSRGGQITYGSIGASPHRKFVVTWDQVPLHTGLNNLPLTFQVVLEETTQRIVFQYLNVQSGSGAAGGATASIGIENDGGFLAAPFLFDGSRILPDQHTLAFTPISGSGLIVGPERALQAVHNPDGSSALNLDEFQLLNSGSTLLGWRAESDQPWLLLSKTQGVLGAGQAEAVVARIGPTASSLAPGSYPGSVRFDNLTSGTGSITRQVQLIVNGDTSNWDLTPAEIFRVTGPLGGPFTPLSRIDTLSNTGERLIDWTAEQAAPWLDIDPPIGILGAGESASISLRLTPTVINLPAGVHESPITIQSENAPLEAIQYPVQVVVLGDPSALVVDAPVPALRNFHQAIEPETLLVSLTVENRGNEAADWEIQSDQDWLAFTPENQITAPGDTVTIQAQATELITRLGDGVHAATLTLTDHANPNSSPAVRHFAITLETIPHQQISLSLIDGEYQIELSGAPSTRYLIQSSSDLETWQLREFLTTDATGNARYPLLTENPESATEFFRFLPATTP